MKDNGIKKRYDIIAITLHWVMAFCILLMLGSGLSFDNIPMSQSFKFYLYQWHKSLGLLLLAAVFLRIGWRLFHKPPAEPSQISKRDQKLALLGHWALYAAMIAMPFAGWAMVSSSPYGLPTYIFGLFEWPHLPVTGNDTIHTLAKQAHYYGGWGFIGLIAVHTGAVIKHYYFDHVNLLPRMGIGQS
jgi:cytochrome b561